MIEAILLLGVIMVVFFGTITIAFSPIAIFAIGREFENVKVEWAAIIYGLFVYGFFAVCVLRIIAS